MAKAKMHPRNYLLHIQLFIQIYRRDMCKPSKPRKLEKEKKIVSRKNSPGCFILFLIFLNENFISLQSSPRMCGNSDIVVQVILNWNDKHIYTHTHCSINMCESWAWIQRRPWTFYLFICALFFWICGPLCFFTSCHALTCLTSSSLVQYFFMHFIINN